VSDKYEFQIIGSSDPMCAKQLRAKLLTETRTDRSDFIWPLLSESKKL
jgi:hypothetical protein